MGERKGSDAFESQYMSGGAEVRHRDKNVSRKMALILAAPAVFTLLLTVFVALTNSTADKPVPPAVLPFVLAGLVAFAAMFVTLSLTFAVLRTVVTEREVIVKYGLWGPRISLDSITGCRVIAYDWTKFGGWGIRRGAGGVWAYVPASGDVVELRYREGDEEKCVLVGAQDPQALASQIQRAREKPPALRIETDAAEREAEEELAAVEEAGAQATRRAQ